MSKNRPDQNGKHEATFKKNKKRILETEEVCAICGRPVDKTLRFPHPMSPTIDHIIPIEKGGHPSDISNLQLAHFACNRQKSTKILVNLPTGGIANRNGEGSAIDDEIGNDKLPLSTNWEKFYPNMTI